MRITIRDKKTNKDVKVFENVKYRGTEMKFTEGFVSITEPNGFHVEHPFDIGYQECIQDSGEK